MKNKDLNINKKSENENVPSERRKFLSRLGKAAVAGAAVGAIGVKPFIGGKSSEVAAQKNINVKSRRALKCYQLRVDAAQKHFDSFTNEYHVNNNDEYLYENKIANFTKGLPHNSNGEVSLSAYNSLLRALRGTPADFEQIQMGGNRRLINPQSGMAFDMEGNDSQSFYLPPAPAFASRETAAEIAENYWMALLRDVPVEEYSSNPIAQAAAADLNIFASNFKGAKNSGGQVSPNLLFRGLTAGDKTGPHHSQFFYQECYLGVCEVSQRIKTILSPADGGQDFMTDFNTWLAVQNGVSQGQCLYDPIPRYVRNGRDIGQWVHTDVVFQAYFQAFLILCHTLNAPFDRGNPYRNSTTQEGFGTFGAPHAAVMMTEVATRALKAVWFQKWYVHRRLRPEVFAGRVHQTLYDNANYPVHSEILNSVGSSARLGGYLSAGNALLPMAFPEGSPTHPSYGAGHATVAGACATVLKAFFDESTVIQNPLVPDSTGTTLHPYSGSETLTVGGELNKLASNIALARNVSGVHWRSDATESLKLGEELAISILRDQAGCYNEQFDGFSLTKFDGTTVTV